MMLGIRSHGWTFGPSAMRKAFVALLPFDIEVVAGSSIDPRQYAVDGRQVTFYWPFWHEKSIGRRLQPVRAEAIPSRPGFPLFPVAPLALGIEVMPNAGLAFVNALRFDVEGINFGTAFANDLANNLIRILRASTGQWWMGHPHREGEGIIRAEYEIDANGVATDQSAESGIDVKSRFGIESPLTAEGFAAACSGLASGQELPVYAEVLYDAVFFAIERNDIRRALLEACIACDMAIIHEAIRAGTLLSKPEQFVRRNLSESDMLHNLRKALPTIFGEGADFPKLQPETFEGIRLLWAARGSIAHGLAPTTGAHGRASLPVREKAFEMLNAAFGLVAWLQQLPPTMARA